MSSDPASDSLLKFALTPFSVKVMPASLNRCLISRAERGLSKKPASRSLRMAPMQEPRLALPDLVTAATFLFRGKGLVFSGVAAASCGRPSSPLIAGPYMSRQCCTKSAGPWSSTMPSLRFITTLASSIGSSSFSHCADCVCASSIIALT